MKKFSNFMAVIGAIAVIAVVLITLHYGTVKTAQTNEAMYQRRLHWMDRNR